MQYFNIKAVDLVGVFKAPTDKESASTAVFREAVSGATAAVWVAALPTNGDRIEALVTAAAKMFHDDGYSQELAVAHVADTFRVFYKANQETPV